MDVGVVLITESLLGSGVGVQLGEPTEARKFREEISDGGAPNEIFVAWSALGALVARRARPAMIEYQNDKQR
jgi:hypothetical protein